MSARNGHPRRLGATAKNAGEVTVRITLVTGTVGSSPPKALLARLLADVRDRLRETLAPRVVSGDCVKAGPLAGYAIRLDSIAYRPWKKVGKPVEVGIHEVLTPPAGM